MLLNQKPTKIVDTGLGSFKKNIFKTRNHPNQFKPTLAKDLASSTTAVKNNITGITKDFHLLDRLKRPKKLYTVESNNFNIDIDLILEVANAVMKMPRFSTIATSLARKAKSISPARPYPKMKSPVYVKRDQGNDIPVKSVRVQKVL